MEGGVTDYRTMSGAEFKREVGDDPDKWAEAFLQNEADAPAMTREVRLSYLTDWFRDAMQAARDDEQHHRIA